MADDTTAPSYWLNWRFLLCAIWILVAMVFAALLIWRHEGHRESRDCSNRDQQEAAGCLYDDEVWGTCSKSIHPIWLLAYRIVAFSVLLALLLADLVISGAGKFYFYTDHRWKNYWQSHLFIQSSYLVLLLLFLLWLGFFHPLWTFTLVTIYFGLGSSLSFHGSLHLCHDVELDRDNSISSNAERGSYVPPQLGENAELPSQTGSSNCYGEPNFRTAASVWGYVFQIVFQMSAGAVMLTDSVFWLILYPSLIANAYQLSFLIVCKHSINAILLLGDVIINRLRFPFFRVAYFVLWTCTFVLFQWIIHACASIRWPYPFLDLSSPYAPLWYLGIGFMALTCYGICIIIFRVKQRFLSR